jgi:hypothetical protein
MNDESEKLMGTLLQESDRGLVLAGAAFLDNALKDLLDAAFCPALSKHDRKQLFGQSGPLSSMYSRTLLAYAFQLIDEPMRNSLDLLRDVRNHFAHYAGLTVLPSDRIDQLLELGHESLKLGVEAFGSSEDPKFSGERIKVSMCIVSMWAKLRHKSIEIRTGSTMAND